MRRFIFILLSTLINCQYIQPFGRFRRQQYTSTQLWPDGIVYYYFNDDSASQDSDFKEYTQDAMDLISEVSCITFVEDDDQDHTIRIERANACFSDIGMTSNPGNFQALFLEPGCEEMEAVHELLHALGFMHIQQRLDRDDYVKIDYTNIQPKHKFNFDKYDSRKFKEIVPYDYGSIMHYGQYSFASNKKKPTIIPVDEDYAQTIGSRKMSFYDIKMINDVYKCHDKCKHKKTKCENYGYMNPYDCDVCLCPQGYKGDNCDSRTDDGCGATFTAGTNWAMQILISNYRDEQVFDRPHYCNYWIEAPEGAKIEVKINRLTSFVCREGCDFNFVEIKTEEDPRETYPRFCCADMLDEENVIEATNPTVIVVANMKTHHGTAHIEYRYVEKEEKDEEEEEEE